MVHYELHEFDRDKVFTKQINPKEVNSFKYSPYSVNELGQIIINKNESLDSQRKFISMTTKKTTQSKFNQVVDTEFSEFTIKNTGAALDFLQAKINTLETEKSTLLANKDIDKQRIDRLNSQIETLTKQLDSRATVVQPDNSVIMQPATRNLNSDLDKRRNM
jgi:hypothetical protein